MDLCWDTAIFYYSTSTETHTQPQNTSRKFPWLTATPTSVYALCHPLCLYPSKLNDKM